MKTNVSTNITKSVSGNKNMKFTLRKGYSVEIFYDENLFIIHKSSELLFVVFVSNYFLQLYKMLVGLLVSIIRIVRRWIQKKNRFWKLILKSGIQVPLKTDTTQSFKSVTVS